jgi:kynureninase
VSTTQLQAQLQAQLREKARALDAADPLRSFRDAFTLPHGADGHPLIYLCGHSLGLAPDGARTLVNEELDDWDRLAVLGHHAGRRPWIGYAEQLQDGLSRLAGTTPGEVVAMNSLTVNLHLLMASFYRPTPQRHRIVIEGGAFPSDRHAVASQIAWHGFDPAEALIELAPHAGADLVEESQLEALLSRHGDSVALVLWPGVQYLTGQAFDIARVSNAARRAGARCGIDLAHAIGNLPLQLHDAHVDFAAWCSYKYLNAGPGAIGGAFVHSRHNRADLPGLAGWWGHDPATRFLMGPDFAPARGAAGWQVSNPPILSTAPLLASLQLYDAAGMAALRTKSLALHAMLREEIAARLGDQVSLVTPADDLRHGCQLSMRFRLGGGRNAGLPTGRAVFDRLTQTGVVADWREPDILRVAPAPLYNSFADVAAFVNRLEQALLQSA